MKGKNIVFIIILFILLVLGLTWFWLQGFMVDMKK